ncbi:hypothetical protein ABNN70_00370 [Sporolactobacillus sp. Y61]|uniref:Uncharacterized protein n=1 Tax=Sporolactobacillus sp. Y61 TaxID=3160863 RepID=A0AAU8IGH7_9BACL
MENYDAVLAFFEKAAGPANAGAVAEATGIDKKEVSKIMAKLKKEEKIVSQNAATGELKNNHDEICRHQMLIHVLLSKRSGSIE